LERGITRGNISCKWKFYFDGLL